MDKKIYTIEEYTEKVMQYLARAKRREEWQLLEMVESIASIMRREIERTDEEQNG